jgi:hypothetical protein
MKDAEKLALLLELWWQRPTDKRTSDEIVAFYGWLENNRPELLNRRRGDPYQNL